MFKRMVTLAFLLLLIAALTACGGADGGTADEQPEGGDTGEAQENEAEDQASGEDVDSLVMGFVTS